MRVWAGGRKTWGSTLFKSVAVVNLPEGVSSSRMAWLAWDRLRDFLDFTAWLAQKRRSGLAVMRHWRPSEKEKRQREGISFGGVGDTFGAKALATRGLGEILREGVRSADGAL